MVASEIFHDKSLILIHGNVGVGKTYFVKRLLQLNEVMDVKWFFCQDDEHLEKEYLDCVKETGIQLNNLFIK